MKLLPLILIAALLGCKTVKPYTANASGESVAKSSAFIAAASANIDAAKPDSGKTAKVLLTVANGQLDSASKENDAASNQIHGTQKELARINAIAYDYDNSWGGGKYRRTVWWVKLLAIAALALVIATRANIWSLCLIGGGTIKTVVGFAVSLPRRLTMRTPKAAG